MIVELASSEKVEDPRAEHPGSFMRRVGEDDLDGLIWRTGAWLKGRAAEWSAIGHPKVRLGGQSDTCQEVLSWTGRIFRGQARMLCYY